uniref:Uncharacterized protein n=1 Tax=Oryza brachyantha TaxID=4533 RepID=J3NFB8_ORYBR
MMDKKDVIERKVIWDKYTPGINWKRARRERRQLTVEKKLGFGEEKSTATATQRHPVPSPPAAALPTSSLPVSATRVESSPPHGPPYALLYRLRPSSRPLPAVVLRPSPRPPLPPRP